MKNDKTPARPGSRLFSTMRIENQGAHARRPAQEQDFLAIGYQCSKIRAALLGAYDRGHRDLPWRRTSDPYAIWVSEVMLQQTRALCVVPYYERFLGSFPTVHALAEAPLERVLEHWSGLGYYRRARMLHEGAAAIALHRDGKLPRDPAELRTIRGIGSYTAGAIASIAFGREEPAIDGNATRVIARLCAFETLDPKPIERVARLLVRGEDPGSFNQALMELGQAICTPRNPSCSVCPVREHCRARTLGKTGSIPPVRKKAAVKRWARVAIVARTHTAVLLARRKPDVVFGGLWEPPGIDGKDIRAAEALARDLLTTHGLSCVGHVRHLLSHRDVRVTVYEARAPELLEKPALPNEYCEIGWKRSNDRVAMSTLAKRILGTG